MAKNDYEDFLSNACVLRGNYKKERKFAKAEFLSELISLQISFGNVSILNRDLMMTKYYKKSMAEEVIKELGYCISHFENYPDTPKDKFKVICIVK